MRIWIFLSGLILLLVGAGVVNLYSFNYFGSVEPLATAQCTPVTGIVGPEDIDIDEASRRAFISSLDRRDDQARGGIHVFNLDDPLADTGWRDRTQGLPDVFEPLGLDYFEQDGVRRLFVVNAAGPSVELFDVGDNGDLTHLETFAERRLTSPNNIVAVGPRAFYVTNDVRPGREAAIASLHFLMRVGSGDVFYVDGSAWRLVAEGLRFANGLAIGPLEKTVYVAETAGNAVRVYDREADTGKLTLQRTIKLKSAPDNINVDEEGTLWVGALPKPLAVPRLRRNVDAKAPSEVFRISQGTAPHTVYRDDGSQLSAVTVAAKASDTLLIGSLYEQKFLLCDLPKDAD